MRSRHLGLLRACLCVLLLCCWPAWANEYCGTEGVWLQILGSGGADLSQDRSAAGYLVWLDNKARVLVDAGPGSALRFAHSGARFRDLDVALFTNMHPDSMWDFPVLLRRSWFGTRKHPLRVLGPSGNNWTAGPREAFASWLTIDPRQAYPAELLAGMPEPVLKSLPFELQVTEIPGQGRRRWTGWRNERLRLEAIPVARGLLPTVAWRLEIGSVILTFAGSASGFKGTIPLLAKGSDILIMHLGASEEARGGLRASYAPPSSIGRVAALAETRMLLLGQRTLRTLGLERAVREQIARNYQGTLLFAMDNDCLGLSRE